MINSKNSIYTVLISGACLLTACVQGQSSMGERVKKAQEWDNLLIRYDGWFGGDGIFAIPLDGKEYIPASDQTRTLILFSDTMIGKVRDGKVKPGEFSMTHNSAGILEGNRPESGKISFYWESEDYGEGLFHPTTPGSTSEDYYWLGDGFVNTEGDGSLYIFAYKIRNVAGGIYPFRQLGVSLIIIPPGDTPPYTKHRQVETPLFIEKDDAGEQATYGSGIFVNTRSAGAPNPDGYIYVYGVKGIDKKLLVCRTKPGDMTNFEEWEFWTGQAWDHDIRKAGPVTSHCSNEMSLSPLPDGRYILTFQVLGAEPEVAVQVGRSPVGPFQPMKKIWHTEEVNEDLDYFTYNAKAHPHLSPKGSLLISYNINSFDFWADILDHPNLYRPRFILLDLDD